MNVSPEEFKEVLERLSHSFSVERAQNHEEIAKAFDAIGYDNPETFNLFAFVEAELNARAVILQHFNNEPKKEAIAFLYMRWNYMDNLLKGFFDSYCGSACCADRSRYVLNGYLHYLQTGEYFSVENKSDYRVPPFGTAEEWVGVCEAIYRLYYKLPSHKEAEQMRAIDNAGKKYVAEQELKMNEKMKRKQKSIINFAEIIQKSLPILVPADDYDAGEIFCQLYDEFLSNSENPRENTINYYLNAPDKEACVLNIENGKVVVYPLNKWTGKPPVVFAQVGGKENKWNS